jgi:transcriptional regulator with XRE-family HTH domain
VGVKAYNLRVATRYGQRFRELRKRLVGGQEKAAAALGITKDRGSSISNIEKRTTFPPRLTTIVKHAKALNCAPWELLQGVPSKVDALRSPDEQSRAGFEVLLETWPVLPEGTRALFVDTAQRFLNLRAGVPTVEVSPVSHPKARRSDRKARKV